MVARAETVVGADRGIRGDRLRIALVAPPWFEVPPPSYGGIEAVVAHLADRLVRRGHDVLLVAAGDGHTAARLARTYPVPPSDLLGQPIPEVIQAAAAARALDREAAEAGPFDVVHDHTLAGPLLARNRDVPTVVTMHGPVEGDLLDYYRLLGDTIAMVAISDAQRRRAPDLPWVGTVHNAVDVDLFPFAEDKRDYVAWLGRYCEEKAPHLAIDAAEQVGLPLLMAGKCNEPPERRYFAERVRPRLSDTVRHLGMLGHRQKTRLLAGARCLVFPIRWEEPFGLVMVEAMACGTPVVALRRGSVPEIVVDGVTGIVCDDPADLPDAIREAKRIDPHVCRRHAVQNFDLSTMISGYERVYRQILAHDRPPTSPPKDLPTAA